MHGRRVFLVGFALSAVLAACGGGGTGSEGTLKNCKVTSEGSVGKPRASYNPENKFAVGDTYRTTSACEPGDQEVPE